MAKASFKMPEDFLLKISKLGDKTDEILPKVLQAGAEVVEKKVRSNLQASIGKGSTPSKSTGQLLSALGASPPRQDKDGNFDVKIGFSEPRADGSSNAMVASVLEYGKSGQPPRPFLKPAKSAAKNECIEAMKAKLESEVGNI